MKNINRRDFLKLGASLTVGAVGSPLFHFMKARGLENTEKKNILLLVFDAFSARHISLYGYNRETTPNLTRLAERAIVYHNHHAGGNFTTPGTNSLLTGTLPWKHRAFGFYSEVTEAIADKSIFHALGDYYRVAYSHNPLVVRSLEQFSKGLNNLIPLSEFLLTSDGLIDDLFSNDNDIASVAWARIIKKEEGHSYSLFLSELYKNYQKSKLADLKKEFPRGLPSIRGDNYFTLEMIMDWLKSEVGAFPRPFMGYFHFIPPHYPYATHVEFYNQFLNDQFLPVIKPEDLFTETSRPEIILRRRQQYDEFILYVDKEFGKLFDYLDESGILDDTWVVLTSDHGELFERGIVGHVTPVLYEPVIHIPLMIFEPQRKTRLDIHEKTSAVDILPTLLHVTGNASADWVDGTVLSPFSQTDSAPNKSIYAIQAKDTPSDVPIETGTISLIKDNYKLTYFFGYKELSGEERIELYDLDADPNELRNIYTSESQTGKLMLEEIKTNLSETNKPYL